MLAISGEIFTVGYNMGCQQQRECYIDCGDSSIKKLKYGDNVMVFYYINKL